jgi:transposase-like protein
MCQRFLFARTKASLQLLVKQYEKSQSKLAQWLEENVPQGLAVMTLPVEQRRFLRTTNLLEQVHKEIKRRTRVAALFPNDASLLRLVSAVLAEISVRKNLLARLASALFHV